jgi:uncharacterized protein (DUF1697 family)
MPRYVALIRAVNVGGTGKLPMQKLQAICVEAGFADVETYIASGNVVFDSKASATKIKAELEKRLSNYASRRMSVAVRTASEMRAIEEANPFPKAPAKFTMVFFLDKAAPRDALDHATGIKGEKMHLGRREIFVHYGEGMGRSKLKIPATEMGTARNMNTVAKLAEMASKR